MNGLIQRRRRVSSERTRLGASRMSSIATDHILRIRSNLLGVLLWACFRNLACWTAKIYRERRSESPTCTTQQRYPGDGTIVTSHALSFQSLRWRVIIDLYWGTRLTIETDKLIALSGIAQSVQEAIKSEYLAGLWNQNWSVRSRTALSGFEVNWLKAW